LAIGIVVDDAIVVVEAVHAELERNRELSPLIATQLAMKKVTRPIIAITLVMSAVFVPAAFLPGPTGIFYRQFSLTVATSIVLSGIVALTLTPALCPRSEEHTSELQSRENLVCRLLLEKKKMYGKITQLT